MIESANAFLKGNGYSVFSNDESISEYLVGKGYMFY